MAWAQQECWISLGYRLAHRVIRDCMACRQNKVATSIITRNLSYVECTVAEVHAECLRSLRKGCSKGEVQLRVQSLPSVLQGLQQEYLKLTIRLPRSPAVLVAAPERLTTALGVISSALCIIKAAFPSTKAIAAAITVRHGTGGTGKVYRPLRQHLVIGGSWRPCPRINTQGQGTRHKVVAFMGRRARYKRLSG